MRKSHTHAVSTRSSFNFFAYLPRLSKRMTFHQNYNQTGNIKEPDLAASTFFQAILTQVVDVTDFSPGVPKWQIGIHMPEPSMLSKWVKVTDTHTKHCFFFFCLQITRPLIVQFLNTANIKKCPTAVQQAALKIQIEIIGLAHKDLSTHGRSVSLAKGETTVMGNNVPITGTFVCGFPQEWFLFLPLFNTRDHP